MAGSKEQAADPPGKRWDSDEVGAMSTEDILSRLSAFGVTVTAEEFARQAAGFLAWYELSREWHDLYTVEDCDPAYEFLGLAAEVLWDRLTPELMTWRRLDGLMQSGYTHWEEERPARACAVWAAVWEHLKKGKKPYWDNIEQAEEAFEGTEFLYNWCQDYEEALDAAGCTDQDYYRQRMAYCREFCELFPASGAELIHQMRRAEAESYFALGRPEEGDQIFAALAEQFPDNAWSYIGWGDAYGDLRPDRDVPPDYSRAQRIYRLGLERNLEEDRETLEARLKDIRRKRRP